MSVIFLTLIILPCICSAVSTANPVKHMDIQLFICSFLCVLSIWTFIAPIYFNQSGLLLGHRSLAVFVSRDDRPSTQAASFPMSQGLIKSSIYLRKKITKLISTASEGDYQKNNQCCHFKMRHRTGAALTLVPFGLDQIEN